MLGISTELALMNSTHSMSDILSSSSILMRVGKSTEKEKRATLYYYFRHKCSNIANRPYTIKFISKCQEFVGRNWLNHLHTNYNHEVLHLHINYNHEVLHNSSPLDEKIFKWQNHFVCEFKTINHQRFYTTS